MTNTDTRLVDRLRAVHLPNGTWKLEDILCAACKRHIDEAIIAESRKGEIALRTGHGYQFVPKPNPNNTLAFEIKLDDQTLGTMEIIGQIQSIQHKPGRIVIETINKARIEYGCPQVQEPVPLAAHCEIT